MRCFSRNTGNSVLWYDAVLRWCYCLSLLLIVYRACGGNLPASLRQYSRAVLSLRLPCWHSDETRGLCHCRNSEMLLTYRKPCNQSEHGWRAVVSRKCEILPCETHLDLYVRIIRQATDPTCPSMRYLQGRLKIVCGYPRMWWHHTSKISSQSERCVVRGVAACVEMSSDTN